MQKYKVNFINASYVRFFKAHRKEIMRAFERCAEKGDFMLRDETRKFEKKLAKYVGTKYAVAVNSGTDALFLSLKALGIGAGDEVITVAHTFIATIQAIVHCGATPVLVDVGEDGLMDMEKVKEAITEKTKAIIPVHLSGKVADMEALTFLLRNSKIEIIEDAAQALGANFNKRPAGSWGITGCFSFNFPKMLGAYGDAGGFTTDDEGVYKKLLLLRNHWNITQGSVRQKDYPQPEEMGWGWKSRMDNIQASILLTKFKYYPALLKRRKQIAEKYLKAFKDLPLRLPVTQRSQVWQEFIIRVEEREKFAQFMNKKGVELLIRDTTPNHKLNGLGLEHFSLLVTEAMAKENVRLPIFPELYDLEIDYIIKCVKEFYGK